MNKIEVACPRWKYLLNKIKDKLKKYLIKLKSK